MFGASTTSASYQISRKPCYVKGQEGTCMFVWECVKTEGTPLGMCMERFMFGSCCAHDLDNNVVPKPSLSSMIATMATNYPTPVAPPINVIGVATPGPAVSSILTALISSVPPWKGNSTNKTAPEFEKNPPHPEPSLAIANGHSENHTSTESTFSNELTSTTSPSPNTVTSSSLHTTTQLIESTTSVATPTSSTPTYPAESTTKPQGSQPTLGSIKLRPKPYRRTTTRRAALPTVATGISTNPPLVSSTAMGQPMSQALASSTKPPTITPSLNLLIPNNLLKPIAVPVSSTAITTLQNPDVLVALPVPISHLSPLTAELNSSVLTSPIELPDSPSSLNEINSTVNIPITIPEAPNKPPIDFSNAHVTSSGVSSTTEADSTESQSVPINNNTSTSTSTVSSTTTTTSFASNQITDVNEVTTVSVTPVETAPNTSTESSSKKPGVSVTPTSYKNYTSTESTKKPTLAVTSLPSTYSDIGNSLFNR